MYKPSEYLVAAVGNRNMIQIHNELCSIIHKDPSFITRDFNDALGYVKSSGVVGVIQPHDQAATLPKASWDKEYWAQVVSDLMDNFSEERIQHVREIGRHLFGSPAPSYSSPSSSPTHRDHPVSTRPNVQFSSSRSRSNSGFGSRRPGGFQRGTNVKKWIPIVAVAGVIVAGIAAIGIKRAMILGVTIVLLGGATILLRNKRR